MATAGCYLENKVLEWPIRKYTRLCQSNCIAAESASLDLPDFRRVSLPGHLASKRRLICRAFILWMAALIAGAQTGCSKNEREPSANNPATAESAAASPALIERGRYLAFAGNCGACHTTAGGPPFAGGLAFETPFGKVYSANITPDPDTGIGGWTSGQFLQSLRKGLRANDQHLYPVFPYPALTKITDEDSAALFALLKSVPAVRYDVPKNEMS